MQHSRASKSYALTTLEAFVSVKEEKRAFREVVGNLLRQNKLIMSLALVSTAAITAFDLIPASFGVPATLVVIWLLMWFMRGTWSDLGIRRPEHWGKTIAIGVAVALISQALVAVVIMPLFEIVGIPGPDYSSFESLEGNLATLVMFLVVAWVSAGLGEEIIFRGFLMGQVARLFGGKAGWGLSLVIVSGFFGLSHAYQGMAGVLLTTYAALVYGLLYLLRGRNLWVTIIAHGSADTMIFLLIYTGYLDKLI